jgi:hypothetical protein
MSWFTASATKKGPLCVVSAWASGAARRLIAADPCALAASARNPGPPRSGPYTEKAGSSLCGETGEWRGSFPGGFAPFEPVHSFASVPTEPKRRPDRTLVYGAWSEDETLACARQRTRQFPLHPYKP